MLFPISCYLAPQQVFYERALSLGVQTCMYTSCLLAMNLRLYGIHIFRFPDLTCTVRQSCWHFEYRTTIPLLYTSKKCIAYSDEIVTTYPVDACAIVTFHDK